MEKGSSGDDVYPSWPRESSPGEVKSVRLGRISSEEEQLRASQQQDREPAGSLRLRSLRRGGPPQLPPKVSETQQEQGSINDGAQAWGEPGWAPVQPLNPTPIGVGVPHDTSPARVSSPRWFKRAR
ncbi:hypothetical protein AAFF_G00213220 [Aldrovandia affinis]|uniref:Uncharacterized protein n=1 Tax=Aldrovandia affinis TaxID=143900 RepID=A0AAD7W596_9TELE|nr:hypothetical protein AAFF_G00213220 [Aldrovandia affinis]